ncbi:MAG: zinc ABC transporter substrate-binding protein [Minisyncoccia bacterium]
MTRKIINRKVLLLAIIFVVILVAVFFLSSRVSKNETQNERIHVVASFYPLSHIVKAVGGNLVEVKNLVPSGVEPHDFELSSRNLVEIGNADALLYNGASLEPWVKKWRSGISVKPKYVINMEESLKKNGTNLFVKDGITDPHFWLDPVIMKSEILVVRDLLIQIDPSHMDLFTESAERFTKSLDLLDEHFRTELSSCALRDIVVLHEAFNYLASRYNIKATSIEGISPDEEPSPKELARIINLVREKGVKHIFFETVASPKFSELIAREVGGETLVLNPIESLTPDEVQSGEDYISIMEINLNNLQIAMQCN